MIKTKLNYYIMRRFYFLLLAICFGFAGQSYAAKLIEVRVVDHGYLMVHFLDGEVLFRDDATGESAYTGHDWSEGDDKMVRFGDSLALDVVAKAKSWRITSGTDKAYGKKGARPVAVYRKSKVTQTTHDWEYAMEHWIFLELPDPMKEGASYSIVLDKATNSDRLVAEFSYDPVSSLSEAVHVNMIGYAPSSPVKSADLYLWMGDGGARDYSEFEGNDVSVLNTQTGELTLAGEVKFWKEVTETEAEGRNLTGSTVWTADFSGFNDPGTYRLVVEDVGCSREFIISDDAFFEPYRFSLRGYYYMRIGEDEMDMVPVPRQPTFIPGKDPEGFTIYMTDLDPYDPAWREHPGDTWDEPHFKPAAESMFWKRRLPGNPTNPNAVGGHSDALDWDRHLAHVSNIYDILLPYYMSGGVLDDDYLGIAESGNSIPDLVDEARNEVDFWLSCRVGDAYAHGLTNPSSERTMMFQAGVTNMAAWANAANCAMLADCFRLSGHDDLRDYYTSEAVKAFEFASNEEEQMLDVKQDIGDGRMRGRDFKMMAAAYLFNLTGDIKWEKIFAEESVVKDGTANINDRDNGVQLWAHVAYLWSPRERHFPELYENILVSVKKEANEHNVRHMDLRPSRRSSNDNYWQTPHNMHNVMLAHALTDDPGEKARYEKSMVLEADWGLGRNPSNIVEMTGLGERHIVNCYTSGRNDGTPGLHPGHTPYNNLDPWGRGKIHNGSNPPWFTSKCYPEWKAGGWPHQEGHFNSRYSWANGEFTPRQTMRGKMALLGYLQYIYGEDR